MQKSNGSFATVNKLSKNGTYFLFEAVPNTGKLGIIYAIISKKGAPQVSDERSSNHNVLDESANTPKLYINGGACFCQGLIRIKRTLYIVTAFIGEGGYRIGDLQSTNANSPGATPEAESASTPTDRVQEMESGVKREFRCSDSASRHCKSNKLKKERSSPEPLQL